MTDDEALRDFDADARDRITARLAAGGCADLAKTLAPSIDLAGGQLEHMKPAMMGVTQKGLYAGAVAMVEQGTVLIVLANGQKVFQMRLQCGFGRAVPKRPTFSTVVKECIRYARAAFTGGAAEELPKAGSIMIGIDDLISKEGAGIGEKTRQLSDEHGARIVGMLFHTMPDHDLFTLTRGVEKTIEQGLCPALVGLTGPGSRSGIAATWPVSFPLAPYVHRVLPPEPSGPRAKRRASQFRKKLAPH